MNSNKNKQSFEKGKQSLINSFMQNRPPSEPYLTGNLAEKYDSDTNEYEEIFFDHDDYSLLKNKKDGEIYLKIGDFLALPNELIDLAGELLDDMPSSVRDDLVKRGLIPLEHFKRREKKLLAKKGEKKLNTCLRINLLVEIQNH